MAEGLTGLTGTAAAGTARSTVVDRLSARNWAALAVLCVGAFLVVLDTTIVNIAIPSIIAGLHSSLDEVLWVLNAYTLVYAALLITGGRLGDLYGPRRLLVLGIGVFVAASVACAVAPSTGVLIAARIAQGVGGALLTPQTLAMIPLVTPGSRRGMAIGLWSGSAGLAAAVGPTLGGVLVSSVGWRSIFLVNIPVGAVAVAGSLLLLPGVTPGRRHRVDLGGIALATSGLFALVFALVEGQRFHWGSIAGPISIPAVAGAGVALLVGFVAWERRQPEPLMPLVLFAVRNFAVSAWVITVFQTVMLAFIVVAGLYLQAGLHLSALEAGLAIAPMPLTIMLTGPLAGRLSDRIDVKYILLVALAVAAGGLLWVSATASVATGGSAFILPLMTTGLGLGFGFAVVMTMGMRGIAPQLMGAASGVLNTSRQVGGALGGAIAVGLLQLSLGSVTTRVASATSLVGALRSTLLVPIALLVLASLSCLLLRGRQRVVLQGQGF